MPQNKNLLGECLPCVVCGSKTSLYFKYEEDIYSGISDKAVRCGNKKCHITGPFSKQEATAVKKWNNLTLIHEKLHKEFFKEKKSE